MRVLLLDILRAAGYEADGAANGALALERLRVDDAPPDLILLDLQMPVLSGWELLAIREADPRLLLIPVLVISGESNFPAAKLRVPFLRKPVEPPSLLASVAKILQEATSGAAWPPETTGR
jgi:CheY-like chemotaxis protein